MCHRDRSSQDQIKTRGRQRAARFYVEGGGVVLAAAGATWYTAAQLLDMLQRRAHRRYETGPPEKLC
jgi:hypothetical protein